MRRPSDCLHQPELHRVPVHARQQRQRAQPLRAQAAFAVGLDEVGDHRVHQHRRMAEHVVEDVGLFEVVELVGAADELSRREAPVSEVLEEDLVGHQPRHGDDLPAGVSASARRSARSKSGMQSGAIGSACMPATNSSQARPRSNAVWRSKSTFHTACSAAA